jgi:diguanylate cyclase (GGDEF)-like protein
VRTHITLKQQSDQLRQYAFIDGLTGLHNRRALDDRLEAELRHAVRREHPLSVLLIDVDYFKKYNDHYGHLMGDEALRQVASALRNCMLRPVDLAARYGGEEFVCMLPDTPLEGAMLVGERLREQLAELAVPHAASEISSLLTVSIGAAAKSARLDLEPKPLLALADAALYEAKRAGRNRVAAAAP